jgi:predicted Holliday junction resolvase-like endonuclease
LFIIIIIIIIINIFKAVSEVQVKIETKKIKVLPNYCKMELGMVAREDLLNGEETQKERKTRKMKKQKPLTQSRVLMSLGELLINGLCRNRQRVCPHEDVLNLWGKMSGVHLLPL